MYLKSIEIIGFKSFADKTKLQFEPGMTSIVGPNGCGKSNVSDAIRWVLGEQSAKALRGSKMEDCIFNGTQNRKPLGMAEVNITFTDCEDVLQTEFHEVTVTRRVFRSGEGQYFINKTPCRLKDVQRLFMDTGVGTSSYSFMAQGRIDQILSARPEDRREIFEEASGITKYKSDKREALRKLEHTEANLLRLADVIREVKRQIGSLQRQAGKAARYKTLRDKMRTLDIYAASKRLKDFDTINRQHEEQLKSLTSRISAHHKDVQESEDKNASLREAILNMEREIASVMEAGVHARGKLDRTQDLIRINSQRIDEYRQLSERDTRELDEWQRQLADRKSMLTDIDAKLVDMQEQRQQAQKDLSACTETYDEHRARIDTTRRHIQQLREDSVSAEAEASRLHNQLMQIDAQERSTLIQRERLTAEKKQLEDVVSGFQQRLAGLEDTINALQSDVDALQAQCDETENVRTRLQSELRNHQDTIAERQSALAARKATLELLTDAEEVQADFPGGTQLLLDTNNPLDIKASCLHGTLAQHLSIDPYWERALEAALRPVIDALVTSDAPAARELIKRIADAGKGAARLVALTEEINPTPPPLPAGTRSLADWVKIDSDRFRPMVERLLGTVLTYENLDQVPQPLPEGFIAVTASGVLIHPNGSHEFWMNEPGTTNPLRRKQAIQLAQQQQGELEQDVRSMEQACRDLNVQLENIATETIAQRKKLDERRRELAQKEGESQMVSREAKTAEQRLETVTWELEQLVSKGGTWDEQKRELTEQQSETRQRREAIGKDIASENQELQKLEQRHSELQTQLTERRVSFASTDHRVEQYTAQREAILARIHEIEQSLQGRTEGLQNYRTTIEQLQESVETAKGQLDQMETAVKEHQEKADTLRQTRVGESERLAEFERLLADSRQQLEQRQEEKAKVDIEMTELRMRRQSLMERITGDYNITLHDIMTIDEPEWEDEERPAIDDLETQVAELRTKLEAMGPVNLVAIEEYQEHEERYTFLSQQEADLQSAKRQLTEMIQTINVTTSEMFRTTFDMANRNFEQMFTRLFSGGSAKLVLVNEEDVLDCGIEIIARPPGKRLQNISLLSGGERTLTAVALLFSIYQIKPSPFCMLDELDAPLDDSNIGRFTDVLKDFLKQSQFVVITHNRRTIAVSDVIYGVTMPEQGVSRVMSMKFRDAEGGLLTADTDSPSTQETP